MRARRKSWTEKEIETNENFIHNPEEFKGKWKEYFSNDNSIHLEIGCGKGRFITTTAYNNPNINYIAVEREKHVIVSAARTSKEQGLKIGFIIGDVTNLRDYFSEREIERLYINFCDPWPNRKKWHKRRLTSRNFLEIYKELFAGKGEIFFKTDNQELFEFSLEEFSCCSFILKNIFLDLHKSSFEGNVMTEYEEKFSEKGMPIYRCEAYIGLEGSNN